MQTERDIIIVVTPGFPENENDTTCLPTQQQLVKRMAAMQPGLQVIVLALQYPYHKKKYTWYGIDVVPFDGRNRGGLSKILLRKKALGVLRKLNETKKIRALLSFWFGECANVAKSFADGQKIRHCCWILGQDARKNNRYPARLKPRPEELLALSDFIQDEFEKNHGIRPRKVIPPGIDTTQFDPRPQPRTIDLLGVGSLIPLKRYELFLKVIAKLKQQFPSIQATLIGTGPQATELKNTIQSMNLEENVIMMGELAHPDVLRKMQQSKVLVHPSSYEGFGVVCIEALYAGASVISFCKPMKSKIPHWHTATSPEEMTEIALSILETNEFMHDFAADFRIEETSKRILQSLLEETH